MLFSLCWPMVRGVVGSPFLFCRPLPLPHTIPHNTLPHLATPHQSIDHRPDSLQTPKHTHQDRTVRGFQRQLGSCSGSKTRKDPLDRSQAGLLWFPPLRKLSAKGTGDSFSLSPERERERERENRRLPFSRRRSGLTCVVREVVKVESFSCDGLV